MNDQSFDRGGLLAGLLFVLVGGAFLLDDAGILEIRLSYLVPVALIVVGLALLLGRSEP